MFGRSDKKSDCATCSLRYCQQKKEISVDGKGDRETEQSPRGERGGERPAGYAKSSGEQQPLFLLRAFLVIGQALLNGGEGEDGLLGSMDPPQRAFFGNFNFGNTRVTFLFQKLEKGGPLPRPIGRGGGGASKGEMKK